jgi:hypothetical protein
MDELLCFNGQFLRFEKLGEDLLANDVANQRFNKTPRKVDFKPNWPVVLSKEEEEILNSFAGNCNYDKSEDEETKK